LKLETPALHEDPLPLLRSIGKLAQRIRQQGHSVPTNALLRKKAEQRIAEELRAYPLRKLIFAWILRQARERVKARENLRFERTRLFGRVRRIFIEIGWRLQAAGRLDEARDIFHLSIEEILGFIDGTTVTTDLQPLVALRKAEFERYRTQPAPADRFETRGIVHQANPYQSIQPAEKTSSFDNLKGLGCCPGIVQGRARVILDPRQMEIEDGEILVASRTDPGWIMLFPAAAGLLVEYGSLLSHSAIVAREMGIPAIVSIPGLTNQVKTGDWLEMDGRSGIIRHLAKPSGKTSL